MDKKDDKNIDKEKKTFDVYINDYYKKIEHEKKKELEDKNKFLKEKKKSVKYEILKYEFAQLAFYARTYREADPSLEVDSQSMLRQHMQFYADLKIKSLLPFILHLRNETEILVSELDLVYKIIESYIVRRMLQYGYDAQIKDTYAYERLDKFFTSLVKGDKFDLEEFVRSLDDWPDDEAIFKRQTPERFSMGRVYQEHEENGGLQRIANETYHSNNIVTRNRAWFLIRYIFYRFEQHLNKGKRSRLADFPKVPTRLNPEPRERNDLELNDWLSIANLTFRVARENNENPNDVNELSFAETQEILTEPPNLNLELYRQILRARQWGQTRWGPYLDGLTEYIRKIWPDKATVLRDISTQAFKSEIVEKPKEMPIPFPDITEEKQDTKLKTYIGELIDWRSVVGHIKCSEFEEPIDVSRSEFKDWNIKSSAERGQKVRFEIKRIQRNNKLVPIAINVVRIE